VELKPQDVLIVLKLLANGSGRWTYARLSEELGISVSQIHSAVHRGVAARLIEKNEQLQPSRPHVKEFLVHGVKYCFPAEAGQLTRGIPTAYAAPPLNSILIESGDPPPVWPYSKGEIRGIAFLPLHRAVPQAAMKDQKLYEMLALLDSIRSGRAREREHAVRELTQRIDRAW
jgi:hypothetical protein